MNLSVLNFFHLWLFPLKSYSEDVLYIYKSKLEKLIFNKKIKIVHKQLTILAELE